MPYQCLLSVPPFRQGYPRNLRYQRDLTGSLRFRRELFSCRDAGTGFLLPFHTPHLSSAGQGGSLSLTLACRWQDATSVPARPQSNLISAGLHPLSAVSQGAFFMPERRHRLVLASSSPALEFSWPGGSLSLALACHRQDATSVPARPQSNLISAGLHPLSAVSQGAFFMPERRHRLVLASSSPALEFSWPGGSLSLALACHRQDATSVPARPQSNLISAGLNWLSAVSQGAFFMPGQKKYSGRAGRVPGVSAVCCYLQISSISLLRGRAISLWMHSFSGLPPYSRSYMAQVIGISMPVFCASI